MTTNNSFFEEQKEQSLVKATIVEKYFEVLAMLDVRSFFSLRLCGFA